MTARPPLTLTVRDDWRPLWSAWTRDGLPCPDVLLLEEHPLHFQFVLHVFDFLASHHPNTDPVAMFTWRPAPSRARPGKPAPMRRWIFEARTSAMIATYTIINVPSELDEMQSLVFQLNRMSALADKRKEMS